MARLLQIDYQGATEKAQYKKGVIYPDPKLISHRFDRLTALRPSKGKLTIRSKVEGPMGFPPWSRGPLLRRGEKRRLSPLVEHGDSNLVFDIT